LRRITGLLALTCAALALAGAAQGALSVGVSEDRGKGDAAGFFGTLKDLGLTENRVSIIWDPAQPDTIVEQPEIEAWLPFAQTAGVRIIFAITPMHARDLSSSPAAVRRFAASVQHVAQALPHGKVFGLRH